MMPMIIPLLKALGDAKWCKYVIRMFDPNFIRQNCSRALKKQQYLAKDIFGCKYEVDVSDHIGYRLAVQGYFDPTIPLLFRVADVRTGVFLDIGANIGTVSLPVARLGNTVISVEPSKSTCSALLNNCALSAPNRIVVVNQAAGGSDEQSHFRELYRDAANSGAASIYKGWNTAKTVVETESVFVTPADVMVGALGLSTIDLIKIDVEGYEPTVLDGARRLLETYKPIVVLEWRPDLLERAGLGAVNLFDIVPDNYFARKMQWSAQRQSGRGSLTLGLSFLPLDLSGPTDNVICIPESVIKDSTYKFYSLALAARAECTIGPVSIGGKLRA